MLLGSKHARGKKIGQVAALSVLTSGKQFDAARARRWLEHVQGQRRVLLQSSSSKSNDNEDDVVEKGRMEKSNLLP
jgi:hypothetical protein